MGYSEMTERDSAAAVLEVDVLDLEKENRELASKQVRQINDTLRKVRRISRESQQMFQAVEEEKTEVSAAPVPVTVQEVVVARPRDTRRERDDNTDKFLIPEPALESPVSEVFRKAFEMFEEECAQFRFNRMKNSPVIRTWKLA
jgi:type I site-specific restriction endonuclease